MRSQSIEELIDTQDWDGIRKNWHLLTKNQICNEDGYVMICNSIRSLLTYGGSSNKSSSIVVNNDYSRGGGRGGGEEENGNLLVEEEEDSSIAKEEKFFPIDIFKWLFRKRWDMIRNIPTVGKTLKEWTKRTGFHEQLYQWICCSCPYEVVNRLPLQVVELILNEHEIQFGGGSGSGCSDYSTKQQLLGARDAAWIVCKMWTPTLMAAEEDFVVTMDSIVESIRTKTDYDLCDLWDRTILFIRHRKPKTTPLLHCAVMGGYPLIIVGLITKLYPHQLNERDAKMGRIPLHYSYQTPIRIELTKLCNTFWGGVESSDDDDDNEGTTTTTTPRSSIPNPLKEDPSAAYNSYTYVQLLIQSYPEGAKYADREGTLPLTLYLERACRGSSVNTGISSGWGSLKNLEEDDRRRADIELFVHAAPDSLTTRDKTTHLLPFMIPCSTYNDDVDDNQDKNDTSNLTLTYDLLQQNPAALNVFINADENLDSFHVQHLRKQMVEEMSQNEENVTKLENQLSVADDTISKQQEEIERLQALIASYEAKL